MTAIDRGDVDGIGRIVANGGDVNVKSGYTEVCHNISCVSDIVAQPILVTSLTGQTVGVGWKESGKVLH